MPTFEPILKCSELVVPKLYMQIRYFIFTPAILSISEAGNGKYEKCGCWRLAQFLSALSKGHNHQPKVHHLANCGKRITLNGCAQREWAIVFLLRFHFPTQMLSLFIRMKWFSEKIEKQKLHFSGQRRWNDCWVKAIENTAANWRWRAQIHAQQILIGGRKANQLIERARKEQRCENENCAISFRPTDPDEPNSLRQQSVEHAGCAMGVCSGEDNRSIHDQLIIIEHRAQNDRLSSLSIVMIVY